MALRVGAPLDSQRYDDGQSKNAGFQLVGSRPCSLWMLFNSESVTNWLAILRLCNHFHLMSPPAFH